MCYKQSRAEGATHQMETDIQYYRFQKVSMDILGPYGESLKGNKYILSFVDWLVNWPYAYAIPDKKTQTAANLILRGVP